LAQGFWVSFKKDVERRQSARIEDGAGNLIFLDLKARAKTNVRRSNAGVTRQVRTYPAGVEKESK
jgi:hypothetical protein